MSVKIRHEAPGDAPSIREVHRLAFGQDDESRLVDMLRAGGHVRVSLVAEIDERIVGHILFSDLEIEMDKSSLPALALAPLAVLPEWQSRGIGSHLVREGLSECRAQGHRIVIVVGDPQYYARFGFDASRAERLASVYSGPAFQVLELVPGALKGVSGSVIYAPPFQAI